MVKGPFPVDPADPSRTLVPLARPYITPKMDGVRVAMRVSATDKAKISRGPGVKGIVTDLDDRTTWLVRGAPCGSPRCYCDAEVVQVIIGKDPR